MKLYTEWTLRYSQDKKEYSEEFKATVPGGCQLDYAKYKGLPDYRFSDNTLLYRGLEDYYWKYATVIPVTNKNLFFYSKGIDYEFEIYIDGEKCFYQEGMFSEVKIEIPTEKQGKVLEVVIFPAPKRKDAEKGTRREADRCYKPPVCYGWDFHPRIITQGIWEETYFVEKEESYINDCKLTYELNETFTVATVKVDYDVICKNEDKIYLNITNPSGKVVYEKNLKIEEKEFIFNLSDLELWWCHNYGKPNLYLFNLQVIDANQNVVDETSKKIGFRRVKLISQVYSWKYWKMPFTQAFDPITIELNGVQVFAKGSNFVSPEVFGSDIDYKRYEELILALKEMHGNIIRVWGGSIVCKDSFYEICDKEGILVLQDFQLSCNKYLDDKHYLDIVNQEATSIIKRLREHPSLAIWSGGNELYIGAENTPQFHVIRLLNSLCFELDRNTPWIDTTPMYGMNHGFYGFMDFYGNECIKLFQRAKATAYNEFGCPSLADYSVLESIIPKENMSLESLLAKDSPWVIQNAIGIWDGESWLQNKTLEHYFGKTVDLQRAVKESQLLQKTGYKFLFEEARRQKYNCSMVMNWCLNEPYPNAGNNCLIGYPLKHRPAFYAVENSLRDRVFSARLERFSFVEGEELKFSLWLLNDGISEALAKECRAKIIIADKEYDICNWKVSGIKADTNKRSNNFKFKLPKGETCIMKLILESDNSSLNNEYEVVYYSKEDYKLLKNSKEKPVMRFKGLD